MTYNSTNKPIFNSISPTIETITYEDGRVYIGHIVGSLKSGKGRICLNDIDIYEGDFREDLYHGKGRLVVDSDTVYEGNFNEGLRSGQGSQASKNGALRYSGEWSEDQKNGYGKFFNLKY